MDTLEIKSSFTRNLLTKLVSKIIQKKLGYKIDIQLNDLDVKIINGKAHLHTDIDVELNNDEFMKIMKSIAIE